MRSLITFNDDWLFAPEDLPPDSADSNFEPATLPHTTKILPHHNFDVSEYAFVSTYRKRFTLPEPRNGRRVFIDFDGAMIASTITINGHTFEEFRGGYVPFSFDITDYLNDDGQNLLSLRLDSTERPDIPPFGNVVDYLAFGGIYRDVYLRFVEPCHIADVFVCTRNELSAPEVQIIVRLENHGDQPFSGGVTPRLRLAGNFVLSMIDQTISVPAHGQLIREYIFDSATLHELESRSGKPLIRLWSLDDPVLNTVEIDLERLKAEQTGAITQDQLMDRAAVRFGFRAARFEKDGFYLNGEKVRLRGLNRHQTYPYIGAAAPARLQRKDADILKFELGCNIVRTSHYPQSKHFLDRCDEIGLLVFEEIPGWQHIGDDDWKSLVLRDVRAMIERDRSHPSIVLWGVRINESQDDEALYTDTNDLAHELDPTRQTGGVRFFQDSQFIEDVFTFNDFSNTVQEPKNLPHLITEFNGHMFSTKIWDQEERAIEHAVRHARIQNKAAGMDAVTGAIGWCAFDYNTHREFGSGDRICYHGVMDIFRLPKFAAYFYESQISPAVRPVLQAATYWTMGDRSGGGNDPIVVFSNCDEVDVYVGDRHHGRFKPDRENYPHLPHPPFIVTDLTMYITWGKTYADLRLVGLIGGQEVIEQCYSADGLPAALLLRADDEELQADGADMTRLVFRITDRFGNRLPYTQSVVTFEIDGPGALIGENPFPLMGGQAAVYVKAADTPGTVTVRAHTPRLEPAAVTIAVREPPEAPQAVRPLFD